MCGFYVYLPERTCAFFMEKRVLRTGVSCSLKRQWSPSKCGHSEKSFLQTRQERKSDINNCRLVADLRSDLKSDCLNSSFMSFETLVWESIYWFEFEENTCFIGRNIAWLDYRWKLLNSDFKIWIAIERDKEIAFVRHKYFVKPKLISFLKFISFA